LKAPHTDDGKSTAEQTIATGALLAVERGDHERHEGGER